MYIRYIKHNNWNQYYLRNGYTILIKYKSAVNQITYVITN